LRVTSGRWLEAGNEIVVTRSFARAKGISPGDALVGLVGTHRVRLTVAGEVIDVDEMDDTNQNPQHAWVLPATLPTLVAPGDQPGYEMAYRFHQAVTNGDLRTALAQIKSVLPAGALGFIRSYIDVRNNYNITDALILTFLLAFSVFALGAAALVIANIVTGAVLAGFREIGVMKAIGYTPAQVVQTLVGQMLIPSAIASLVGIPLGVVLSRPLLDRSADALGLPAPSAISLPALLLVLAGVLVVVCLSAGLPAWRAGRLSPVRAMVAGTTPEGRKGLWVMRRVGRLHLPQSIRLGIGQAFARPLRAAFTMVAILVGVATVTFAFGVRATLVRGMNDPALSGGEYQIEVGRIAPFPDARVMQTLRAQPQTVAVVARDWTSVTVDGLSQPVQAVFTRGDAAKLGLRPEQGRWYAARGEAVAPAAFLKEAHLRVGDFFDGSINGRHMRFHLVGTVFDTSEFGRILHMDFSTLAAAMPGEKPSDYLIRLRPGADTQSYAIQVNQTSRDYLEVSNHDSSSSSVIGTVNDVVVVLALVLTLIAVAAVFNTMLLNTRERMRDTAILKAVGMGPGQTVVMVVTSAAILGLIGAIFGIPIGVELHSLILRIMPIWSGMTS
jgi:putative ABC transport system permease protein